MEPARTLEGAAEDVAAPARAFWIARAEATPAAHAIHPTGRWQGYHAWTRRMLQSWTLQRIANDRPRYRRCVDLGCGFGDWTELFAPLSDEIHACDVAPAFVEQTRTRLADHPNARVSVADVCSFDIPRGADLIYLGGVMTYLPDEDARALLEKVRVAAAPGAHVLVRDWCTFNLGRRSIHSVTGYSVHRHPRELRAMGIAAGLRCLEVRSSPGMYGEVMGRVPPFTWMARGVWRLGSLVWPRASCTLRFRA